MKNAKVSVTLWYPHNLKGRCIFHVSTTDLSPNSGTFKLGRIFHESPPFDTTVQCASALLTWLCRPLPTQMPEITVPRSVYDQLVLALADYSVKEDHWMGLEAETDSLGNLEVRIGQALKDTVITLNKVVPGKTSHPAVDLLDLIPF